MQSCIVSIDRFTMSAFICSDFHIMVVSLVVARHFKTDAQDLADKLKAINIESVNYCYNEKTPKRKCKVNGTIDYVFTARDIAKLIDCLDYQMCEKTTVDYLAYSSMLFRWVEENAADIAKCKDSNLWSI